MKIADDLMSITSFDKPDENKLFAVEKEQVKKLKKAILMAAGKAAQHFAEANLPTLHRQAAAGGGEHLAAFAALNGCSATQTQQVFSTLQSQHAQVFNSGTTHVVSRFRTAVAGICTL